MSYDINIEAASFIESLRAFCLIVKIEHRTTVDALYGALAFTMSRTRFNQVLRAVIATGTVERKDDTLVWTGGAE